MFPFTKNATEYKTLLTDLKLAKKIQAEKLTVFVNSLLVVQQVSIEYEMKDHLVNKYNGLVK